MTPLKAIRQKCLDCCCGNSNEVKLCPVRDCPLYVYRDGHNPKRKGITNKNPNICGIARKSFSESGNQ